MSARQIVRVFEAKAPNKIVQEVQLPEVFLAPVRSDLVNTVFANLNKTVVKLTEYTKEPEWNTTPNPGDPEEPLLVCLVFPEAVLTVVVKVPSPTHVVAVECSILQRSGEDFTEKSTLLKEDTRLPQPLPLLLFLPSFWQEVIELMMFLKSL